MALRSQRPWRKRSHQTGGPDDVFRQLQQRELTDLETCRRVWEDEMDPLAVCEAIRQSDLPDWLAHTLLLFVTNDSEHRLVDIDELWRTRKANAIDATRAAEVAGARSHPEVDMTWDTAFLIGEKFAGEGYGAMPRVSPDGAKKSYYSVRAGLALAPSRYYRAMPGMQERIRDARVYLVGLLKGLLVENRPGHTRE